jgi:hypothetical protein
LKEKCKLISLSLLCLWGISSSELFASARFKGDGRGKNPRFASKPKQRFYSRNSYRNVRGRVPPNKSFRPIPRQKSIAADPEAADHEAADHKADNPDHGKDMSLPSQKDVFIRRLNEVRDPEMKQEIVASKGSIGRAKKKRKEILVSHQPVC